MFATSVPKIENSLDLSLYETFVDKLTAVYEYVKIKDIYIEVNNPGDVDILPPVAPLGVIQMVIQPGSGSYTLSTLKDCHKILSDELTKFIQGPESFDVITNSLIHCIEKCNRGFAENNFNEIFTFDQDLVFKVYNNGNWRPRKFQYLQWPIISIYEDFKEHFNIRKGFFDKMLGTLGEVLDLHQKKPDINKSPYSWESPNAELEISELLYIIYRTSGQLKFNLKDGGTFPKFKRDFFKLFGLSDKNYDKKVLQILARKRGEHFIDILVKKFAEDHAKLFEMKK